MATSNAINANSAGLVRYNGTGTFDAVTTTNHNLLIGATSNGITNVAPSITSGVPIISQGAASDPAVAGGGTGSTSFTAYTPVCGGTTTTGALQSVASIGTTGQVLTSNGAGSLPTFQNVGTAPFANALFSTSDDFVDWRTITSPGVQSDLIWDHTQWVGTPAADAANPGLISNQAVAAGTAGLILGSNPVVFVLGGGALAINWVIKVATLSAASPRYVLQVGMANAKGTNPPTNGIFFNYSDNVNSGNWQGICRASSTSSTANSSTAVSNSAYVNLGITVNAAATSVGFFVNGTQITNSPLASNIPTVALVPFIQLTATVGTTALSSVIVDLMYMSINFTTPR
jgi:hypothetical protein